MLPYQLRDSNTLNSMLSPAVIYALDRYVWMRKQKWDKEMPTIFFNCRFNLDMYKDIDV